MNIIQLTPGTGNFHCENCLHDSALVSALRDAGHNATLYPLYLPLITDEPLPGPTRELNMGGINIFLQDKLPGASKAPKWIKRLLKSESLLTFSARYTGMTRAHDLGKLTLSMLAGSEGRQNSEIQELIRSIREQDKPDVILLSNVMLSGLAESLKNEFKVPVICSLQGEDIFMDSLGDDYRELAWERLRDNADKIDHFVAVSDYYAKQMQTRLEIEPSKITVIRTGVRVADYDQRDFPPVVPAIGFMSRLIPDKGVEELIRAFIQLKSEEGFESLQLRIAGSSTPQDAAFVEKLWSLVREAGIAEYVEIRTNLSLTEKIAHLRSLSVCTVPTRYADAYGLFIIESLAAGTPVVVPGHGGHSELITISQGGLTYPPGDQDALTEALRRTLTDRTAAMEFSGRGRANITRIFTTEIMASQTLDVIERCLNSEPTAMSIEESTMTAHMNTIVELKSVTKSYPSNSGQEDLRVLDAIDLKIQHGDLISIMGPSGCGKSTLLNILGGLDVPSTGDCLFDGEDLSRLKTDARAALRNTRIGFVFQLHHLLPHCTALENVLLPVLALHKKTSPEIESRAKELLQRVGLEDRSDHYPHQLSGGERQRVAVVRALINHPDLILADEPTGALDYDAASDLVDLLIELAQETGSAIVMVSHSAELAGRMTLGYVLDRGVLTAR